MSWQLMAAKIMARAGHNAPIRNVAQLGFHRYCRATLQPSRRSLAR